MEDGKVIEKVIEWRKRRGPGVTLDLCSEFCTVRCLD